MARRYYWGDLRLWRTGRGHEASASRRVLQEFDGVDQLQNLVVAESSNYGNTLDITTLFDPTPNFLIGTKRAFRGTLDEMRAALIARGRAKRTVFYVDDDTNATTVLSNVGGLITTAAAHGLIVGDRALVRRNTSGAYTLAQIVSVPNDDEFTYATPTAETHGIAISDDVFLVEAYWTGCVFTDFQAPRRREDGDYYAEEVVYAFKGVSATYHRTLVDLDA